MSSSGLCLIYTGNKYSSRKYMDTIFWALSYLTMAFTHGCKLGWFVFSIADSLSQSFKYLTSLFFSLNRKEVQNLLFFSFVCNLFSFSSWCSFSLNFGISGDIFNVIIPFQIFLQLKKLFSLLLCGGFPWFWFLPQEDKLSEHWTPAFSFHSAMFSSFSPF